MLSNLPKRTVVMRCLLALALGLFAACIAQAAPLRILNTPHYRIETDCDLELSNDSAKRMNAMYDEYARRFQSVVDVARLPVFRVCIFRHRDDYLALVGDTYINTGGLYVRDRHMLAAVLEGQGRDALRRTLAHEALHQFLHEALPGDLPVWLDEGLAQMFEEGIWTGHDFWLGQVPPRRVRQLKSDLDAGRLVDFRTLAAVTPHEWASALGADHLRGLSQYNQAWAMVQFLTVYKDAAGQEIYRPRLLRLLQLIHEGTDPSAAFSRVFSDAADIDRHFQSFVRTLQPTLEAVMIERQGVLADLLAELHAHHVALDDIPAARRALQRGGYRVRYWLGDARWESDADVTTYFCAPDGRPYDPKDLRFVARPPYPLPDVVCRCFDGLQLRTRFHIVGDKIEHEILIEPQTTSKSR